MKKKCTNSACRRVFSVAAAGLLPTCPYCGKAYPRLAATHSVGVLLVGRNLQQYDFHDSLMVYGTNYLYRFHIMFLHKLHHTM